MRYVAIGDSISEGVGDTPWPDGTARGWTDRLAVLLDQHHHPLEYANLAVRGYKAGQVRERQLAAAVALAPDVITITAGMNDILRPRVDFDDLGVTLTRLVMAFASSPTKVLLVPVPDVSGISPAGRWVNPRRVRLNDIYRQLADQHGAIALADSAGTVFEDRRAWDDDRLHPSPLGHERLAAAAADALGVPTEPGYMEPPPGAAPGRTLRTEADWWWRYAAPWVGRRVRGQSSGDGRSAKRPTLVAAHTLG